MSELIAAIGSVPALRRGGCSSEMRALAGDAALQRRSATKVHVIRSDKHRLALEVSYRIARFDRRVVWVRGRGEFVSRPTYQSSRIYTSDQNRRFLIEGF
jgi:hypothetical protein